MNLNRIDWTRAQDLLVNLVQILTPFTDKETDRKPSTTPLLNNRFFIPPAVTDEEGAVFRLRHPVSLLKTTLRSTQQQVNEWIEQLPEAESESTSQKRVTPPSLSTKEKTLPQAPSKPAAETKREGIPPSKPNPPLSMQAQLLIKQVRDVIGTLCTSSNIIDPKAPLLREALKRIKPMIDELIEAVARDGKHSANQEEPKQTRSSLLPATLRDHLVKKWLPLPQSAPKSICATEQRPASRNEEASDHSTPKTAPNKEALSTVIQNEQEKDPKALFSHTAKEGSPQRPIDRVLSLPAAPFVPETRSLTAARKKKKRKGFWFREEKEDPTQS